MVSVKKSQQREASKKQPENCPAESAVLRCSYDAQCGLINLDSIDNRNLQAGHSCNGIENSPMTLVSVPVWLVALWKVIITDLPSVADGTGEI